VTKESEFSELWNRPGFLVRRLHQIHIAMFLEGTRKHHVTPVQFGVLSVLNDRDEALDQVTIAAEVGIDRNTAADVIRRLQRRGLLERPESDRDKRAKLARLSEEGRAFVRRVFPAMERAQDRFIKPLNAQERKRLRHLMQKLVLANNDSGRARLRLNSAPASDRESR